MAMRINTSQEAKARQEGRFSFSAGRSMNHDAPVLFLLNTPLQARENLNVFPDNGFWERAFKRNDITDENHEVLNGLWLEGYTEAYDKHMFAAMTPETKELHEWKRRNLRGTRAR